jgi:hypothetical protein
VLVYWKIVPDKESEFLKWWWETTQPPKKPKGLIVEMLSKQEEDESNTWHDLLKPGTIIYMTVGLWEDKIFFKPALSKLMNEKLPFEASLGRECGLSRD